MTQIGTYFSCRKHKLLDDSSCKDCKNESSVDQEVRCNISLETEDEEIFQVKAFGKKILKVPNLDCDEKVVKHLEALMDTKITVHTTKGREENELYASFIEFH